MRRGVGGPRFWPKPVAVIVDLQQVRTERLS